MSASSKKGRELEDAVLLIERAILGANPTAAASSISVEPRKILNVVGVHHEYDLWVELRGVPGYESVFVFECKNWIDKVGKNDVIILSAKIAAAQAQRGFLVAREFTADARAQAALDPRVELLDVRKEQYDDLQAPLFFHFLILDRTDYAVRLIANDLGAERPIDLGQVELLVDGQRAAFGTYLDQWKAELVRERTSRFGSALLPAGEYPLENEQRRAFKPGSCSFEGHAVDHAHLKVKIAARILRPTISGSIEVVGRGRVLHMTPIAVAGVEARMSFVALPRGDGEGEPNPGG